jgi:hypothetical protein
MSAAALQRPFGGWKDVDVILCVIGAAYCTMAWSFSVSKDIYGSR